ncbi:toxin-antitoxin system YwqK family antitoxin [Sunxiuqinia sp. sy24]|uniref:toxin-antitoxin system YwqK family antitoxin n=1 Tax=Sunxiuqinia sp. sy24 TaxID=3461495 RepID=UPI0040463C15
MIRYLFLFLLVLTLHTTHAQEQLNQIDQAGQKQGFWQKKQANGNLAYEGNFVNDKPVGVWKRYHSNGLLKARLSYKENSDTIQAELFDTRGKLMAQGRYLNQLKTGQWLYFQKGTLVSEEHFESNLKQGLSKTYYPSGELFEETNWKDDEKNGIYRAYFKNGKPYMECMMKQGTRDGACQIYFENGQLELDALYVKGLRHGQWNYSNPDGSFSHSLHYDLGTLTNPRVLDSIQHMQFKELEENKKELIDPEKFMNDPMQYMIKNKMLRR